MTLTARSRRASLTGATLAVAAVLTAGCSPSSSSSGSSVSAGASASAAASGSVAATTGGAGGGAAGSFYSVIGFTNTSNAACTLYGYPGVSLTTASGAQIGAAATRDATAAPRLVTLAPGATANAELRMTDPTVYSAGKCQPTTSAFLKIYPPNQTQPVQISFRGPTCASIAIKMLSIGVVTAGTS